MALDKESVKLGINILKRINQGASVVMYELSERSTSYVDTNKIYCLNGNPDDGYSNVFTNIENMTDDQRELWNQLKGEVPNTSFCDKLEKKDYHSHSLWEKDKDKIITCLGWF